jgi:cytochrome c-type biogenesis protein CcmH/NrfF
MKRLAELLLLGCAVILMMGADAKEARFQRLGDKIMCTCSCAQMLLKCNHVGCPNSDRMIAQLHALTGTSAGPRSSQVSGITELSNDEDVLNWFRRTWGVTAVVEPATHGLELWAWILPPTALTLGLGLAIVLVRRWRKQGSAQAQSAGVKVPLDPHLEAFRDRARRETEL